MSRKRSLRRIWPVPTLAAMLLSVAACASKPVSNANAGAHAVGAAGEVKTWLRTTPARAATWSWLSLPTRADARHG
jgi:hypothetical protein